MNVSVFENAYLSRVNTIMQSEDINLRVANALRFVIQNVFANLSQSFFFTLSTSGGATGFWLHDLMGKVFKTWGLIAVQLVILDSRNAYVDVPGKRYCNLIMVDSFESLKRTNIAEYNRKLDSVEYYFIFLQTQDWRFNSETNKILKYCYDNYWIDCNIMAQNSKGEILVYTYFPFKENNCFKTEPELINRYVENQFENNIMFPDKLSNLQGCPLKLSTWNETSPFVIDATNKRMPSVPVAGFEVFTMIAVSQKMNFTLNVEWLTVETYDQQKSPETMPLSRLTNYDTNFTMGYFRRTADRDKIATPTYTTYYIPLVAIILRKEAHHESMGIWTFPFDTATWVMTCISYFLIGMLNVLKNMERKGSFFGIYALVIGIPITKLPKWTSTRIHIMTTILSSFILRSVYQSLLFYMFRTNFYQAPPLTFDSLVELGYRAVATELTSRFLLYVPQIKDNNLPLTVINSTSEMSPLRYIELYRNESWVAMSIVEYAIRYVSEDLADGEALQVLPMNVKDQQICFYLPKHSFYSDRLGQYILRLQQGGLLNKWREWTIYDYQVVKIVGFTEYANELIVNLNQLVGFLFLIILLFLTSFIVFMLELMSKRFILLQKLF